MKKLLLLLLFICVSCSDDTSLNQVIDSNNTSDDNGVLLYETSLSNSHNDSLLAVYLAAEEIDSISTFSFIGNWAVEDGFIYHQIIEDGTKVSFVGTPEKAYYQFLEDGTFYYKEITFGDDAKVYKGKYEVRNSSLYVLQLDEYYERDGSEIGYAKSLNNSDLSSVHFHYSSNELYSFDDMSKVGEQSRYGHLVKTDVSSEKSFEELEVAYLEMYENVNKDEWYQGTWLFSDDTVTFGKDSIAYITNGFRSLKAKMTIKNDSIWCHYDAMLIALDSFSSLGVDHYYEEFGFSSSYFSDSFFKDSSGHYLVGDGSYGIKKIEDSYNSNYDVKKEEYLSMVESLPIVEKSALIGSWKSVQNDSVVFEFFEHNSCIVTSNPFVRDDVTDYKGYYGFQGKNLVNKDVDYDEILPINLLMNYLIEMDGDTMSLYNCKNALSEMNYYKVVE